MLSLQRSTVRFLAIGTALFGTGLLSGVMAASFRDVSPTHWAYNDINWVSENEIMNGPDTMPGYFDPAGVVNRAQLATVLARYDRMIREHIDALDRRVDRLEGWSSSMSNSSSRSSSLSSSSMSSSTSSRSSSSSFSSSSSSSSSFSSTSSSSSSFSSLGSSSSSSSI